MFPEARTAAKTAVSRPVWALPEGDEIRSARKVRSLPRLRGRAGVGASLRLPEWREPPPGASRRPPPQAGEVKRARGHFDSAKKHHALSRLELHPLDLADDDEIGECRDQRVGADEHQGTAERAGRCH